jgi:hypothetical protein
MKQVIVRALVRASCFAFSINSFLLLLCFTVFFLFIIPIAYELATLPPVRSPPYLFLSCLLE